MIENLVCCSIYEFVDKIISEYKYYQKDYGSIVAIATFNESECIIKELLRRDYPIAYITLEKPSLDFMESNDEYIITFDKEGIWCEYAKVDGRYLYVESDMTFVSENCDFDVDMIFNRICYFKLQDKTTL